jgi:hypothetical protein
VLALPTVILSEVEGSLFAFLHVVIPNPLGAALRAREGPLLAFAFLLEHLEDLYLAEGSLERIRRLRPKRSAMLQLGIRSSLSGSGGRGFSPGAKRPSRNGL